MDKLESSSHTARECKYHVIFIPKCRRKTLYRDLRQHLREMFRKLAAQKESQIVEGRLMPDHVYMAVAIAPKYVVSQVICFIKGKIECPRLCRGIVTRKRAPIGGARPWIASGGR